MPAQTVYDQERRKIMLLRGPNYFDAPEGKHPWEKLWGINKYCIAGSLHVTTFDALFISQAKNVLETLNIFGFWLVRSCSLATAFTSTVYIANTLRKDDMWNYSLGVIACMPITYAWWKSCTPMFVAAAGMEAVALLAKTYHKRELPLYVQPKFEQAFMYNYSLVKAEWPRRPY